MGRGAGLRDHRIETAAGVIEHGFDVLAPDSGKPGKKVIDRGSVLQVFKERRYLHTCATEDPGAAKLVRGALHSRALRPIEHL